MLEVTQYFVTFQVFHDMFAYDVCLELATHTCKGYRSIVSWQVLVALLEDGANVSFSLVICDPSFL